MHAVLSQTAVRDANFWNTYISMIHEVRTKQHRHRCNTWSDKQQFEGHKTTVISLK